MASSLRSRSPYQRLIVPPKGQWTQLQLRKLHVSRRKWNENRVYRYSHFLFRPHHQKRGCSHIPTTQIPEGFRAYDRPVLEKDIRTEDGRFDPFAPVNHKGAKKKNSFEWDPNRDFTVHPIWTPIVPAVTIGLGIYIIITGVIANPPGDDDDDDD